jgi:hypothetical protein
MSTTTVIRDEIAVTRLVSQVGWALTAVGLAGIAWWIWAWTRVNQLITRHVAESGPLPDSPFERAALYVEGTPAERQLSNDLEAISGLYPWGPLPLILATTVALIGFGLALRQRRRLAAVGIVATLTFSVLALSELDSTMAVALDILE